MATVATGMPLRHLDHGEQRVESREVGQRHRDADHRQRGRCGHHAGEVGGATGGADDHLHSGLRGPAGERDGVVRRAVRGEHPNLCLDLERTQGLDRVVHVRRVGCASHDDGDGHAGILPDPRAARYGGPARTAGTRGFPGFRGSPRRHDAHRRDVRHGRAVRPDGGSGGLPSRSGIETAWSSQIFSYDALTALAVIGREVPGIASGPRSCRPTPATRSCWPPRH